MAKFGINDILNAKTKAAGQQAQGYKEIYLSPYEVKAAEENTHQKLEGIEELADSFLHVGQEQPTVLAKDDLGVVQKTILTSEDVTLKAGLLTWCAKTLEKLCATARVTETAKKRTVKIGGIKNQNHKKYLIRFLHEDSEDGDIRVTIVGRNEAGFSFTFAKDAESTIEPQFKAHPMDKDGTLLIFDEDIVTEA